MTDIDKGFEKIKKELETLNNSKLYIYINDKATYENGIKVDFIAMLMEYGSEEFEVHFPARPFFSSTFEAHLVHFTALYEKNIAKVIEGKMTANALLHSLGKDVVKKVREMIESGSYAPLSPATIKKKGHNKPLFDTGTLLRSVKYKIE